MSKGMSSPSYNERGELAQYQNGLISPLPYLNNQQLNIKLKNLDGVASNQELIKK